jgi:hypothetical protein
MQTPSTPAPRSLLAPALVLAGAFLLGAIFLAGPLNQLVLSHRTITVKVYAERRVDSDFAVWSATVTTRGKLINAAADQMDKNCAAVTSFLLAQGVPKEKIVLSDLTTTPLTKSENDNNQTSGELDGYKLDRSIEVASGDVDGISRLTEAAPALLLSGLEISFNSSCYYCTKLADLKVSLLGEAVQDAQRRAQEIAGKSGRKIGALRSASQGVFQITSVYETETSPEGSFDTASPTKTVRAVVTAEFELD